MKTLIILILLFPILISSELYTNTPLGESSGIFYNNLGNAKISNSDLTLLTHLNITYLNEARFVIKSIFKKSLEICNTMIKDENPVKVHCHQNLEIIRRIITDLQEKYEILNHIASSSSDINNNRKKRGIFNGASYIFNWLFGTPNADDAKYYTDSINALLNDNRQTQTLLKSQVEIISSTIRNLNNSINILKQTEDQLNNNIKLINKYSIEMTNEINRLNVESILSKQLITLSSLAMKINNDYDNNINAVALAKHGILSPLIVTPKILLEELLSYKEKYNLPLIPKYENIYVYYRLLSLQVYVTDNIIVFALKIPLVSKDTFIIFQMIPLPIQHGNESLFSFIEPKRDFLLLSQTKTQYSLLQDLSNCLGIQSRNYISKNIHTNKRIEKSTCEIELLAPHINKIPEDCNTKTIKATIETWNYIDNNQWIYVLQKPTTLTLICDSNNIKEHEVEDIVLHHTGILKLYGKCRGYTDHFILETTDKTKPNITYYIPSINIVQDDCCVLTEKIKMLNNIHLTPVQLTNIDLTELKYADKKLNQFDDVLTEQLNKPFIITYTRWYNVALAIIGIIILCILCLKCCGHCKYIKKLFGWRDDNTIVKNFINCCFCSEPQHHQHEEVAVYDPRNELIQMRTIMEAPNEDQEEFDSPPRYWSQPSTYRRSTTLL